MQRGQKVLKDASLALGTATTSQSFKQVGSHVEVTMPYSSFHEGYYLPHQIYPLAKPISTSDETCQLQFITTRMSTVTILSRSNSAPKTSTIWSESIDRRYLYLSCAREDERRGNRWEERNLSIDFQEEWHDVCMLCRLLSACNLSWQFIPPSTVHWRLLCYCFIFTFTNDYF